MQMLKHLTQILLCLCTILALTAHAAQAQDADPTSDTGTDQSVYQKKLRPIPPSQHRKLKDATLFVMANYSVYSISVNGQAYPTLYNEGVKLKPYIANEILVSTGTGGAKIEKKYTISLKPAETLYLYVELGATTPKAAQVPAPQAQAPPSQGGFLSVTSEVEGQVYVDGKLAIAKSPLEKHPVSTGSHSVRIYYLDTRKFSKSREIYVAEGNTMSMHFAKE